MDELLYLRTDTPKHSILHEACHYICMDSKRGLSLYTDAGSDDDAQEWLRQHQLIDPENQLNSRLRQEDYHPTTVLMGEFCQLPKI